MTFVDIYFIGVLGPLVGAGVLSSVLGLLQEVGLVPVSYDEESEHSEQEIPKATVYPRYWRWSVQLGTGWTIGAYILIMVLGNMSIGILLSAPLLPGLTAAPIVGLTAYAAHRLCVLNAESEFLENLRFWLAVLWFFASPSLANTLALTLLAT